MSITELLRTNPKLTPTVAAEYLGVSIPTLATWRCRGGGPKFLKVGAKVVYRLSDLDEWLESRCVSFSSQLEG